MPLDAPPARDLLPDSIQGFQLGFENAISPRDSPFPGMVDGHSRIFDGSHNGTGRQVHAAAMRFESDERAQEAMSGIVADADANATRPALGDDAVLVEPPSGQGATVLAVREGPVVWILRASAYGPEAPLPDLVEVAAPLVARVGA